jgi:hypothetical protein
MLRDRRQTSIMTQDPMQDRQGARAGYQARCQGKASQGKVSGQGIAVEGTSWASCE